jgi:hypothetical protein
VAFDALATASAASQPLDAGHLDLKDGPFMMDGLTDHQRQRFNNDIQRRRDFARAAGEVVQHTARNLPDQIIAELEPFSWPSSFIVEILRPRTGRSPEDCCRSGPTVFGVVDQQNSLAFFPM